MRRHTRSGATLMVVLSLVATACGEKGNSVPGVTSPTTPTPASPLALTRIADTLAVDESLQLNAIVPLLPGSPPPITWSSSDENVAIVTRSGLVYGVKSGKTIITVTSKGVSASTAVTVRPTIRDIRFASDTFGISLSDSVRLPYKVIDSDGQPIDLSSHKVEWSSTSPDVAPLTGNATVTGRALGIASVTLRVDSKTTTTNVHVMPKPVASVSVSPASVAVLPGQEMQLTATTYDVHGRVLTGRTVTWSSSNTAAATVSATGVVKGIASGKADVTAVSEGQSAVVPVTVSSPSASTTAAPVTTVSVTLNAPSLVAGQSTQANAVLKDASNNVLTGRTIAWSSSDITVATVSATGLVTSIKAGTATITAVSEGVTGGATLTVTAPSTAPAPVASVTVTLSAASALVGSTAQATATLKDSVGNVLTGRTITWVSSDASVATVSSSGLLTAVKAGSVTITASSGTVAGSAMFTATAPTPAVHMIALSTNASTIKIGELTQVTGVVKDVNGNVIDGVTIFWSSSPTSVATISTSGMVTGRGAGTATIYAKADTVTRSIAISVIDSATTVATSSTSDPTVPSGATGTTYGSATPAELPRVTVSTTYPTMTRQVRVPAGADLQAALINAQPGDELLLAPGATYVGNFWLPNKGATTGWIVLRTDLSDAALGAAGTRMTPSRASTLQLAKILTPNGQPVLDTELGAHHYRFTGVEIGATSTAVDINAIVRFGTDQYTQNSAATTANNLIVDRSYVHGLPTLEVRRCVLLNSATSAVVDSWLAECHSNVSDSQAIVGWNGPGPFLIQNNHLEAGHEVIVFGGGTFTVTNGDPSDITIRGNHVTRPLSWKGIWQTKNLLETKHVRRLLIEGNVFESNWADAQAGFAFVLKSENQQNDNPWTQSADITIRYNRIRNTGNVWNLAANPSGLPALPAARMVITDNIVENVNVAPYNGDGHTLQLLGGLSDIVLMHNTVVSANGSGAFATVFGELPVVNRLVIHSNVQAHGTYGMKGGGVGEGSPSISTYAPGALVTNNAIASGGMASAYPANNWFPAGLSNIGFVDLANGDYRLSSSSTYLGKGYDGRDIGADINQVNAATRGAVVAP